MSGPGRPGPAPIPVVERFWPKVDQRGPDECWPWTAQVDPGGYGRFHVKRGKIGYAHRASYELLVGPIPEDLELDHLCRNRACVNPAHLELVTTQENTRRGIEARKREQVAS